MLLRSIIALVIIFLSFVVVDVFSSICMTAVFITLFLGRLTLLQYIQTLVESATDHSISFSQKC